MNEEKKTEEMKMEEITIERDSKKNLKFTGTLIGSATTRRHKDMRWDVYEMYLTKAGKYVLHHDSVSLWSGEPDRCDAGVFASKEAALESVGFEDEEIPAVIKELAQNVGIDVSEHVD